MVSVAVVYHSGEGQTAVQALAVADGAASVQGTSVRLISVEEVDRYWAELGAADAIVFGAPTHMGSASAPFKGFMDASAGIWLRQGWKDKIAAGFTNIGNRSGEKLNTLMQLAVFAAQHGMLWVGLGLMPGHISSRGAEKDINRLGSFLGAMSQSNMDGSTEVAPPASDRATAALLGRRVALTARQWTCGRKAVAGGARLRLRKPASSRS